MPDSTIIKCWKYESHFIGACNNHWQGCLCVYYTTDLSRSCWLNVLHQPLMKALPVLGLQPVHCRRLLQPTWICKARWVEEEQGTLFSNKQWLTHCYECMKPAHLSRFMLLWMTTLTDLCYNCWIRIQYHFPRTWLKNIVKMILSNTLFHHWNSAHFTGTYFNPHLKFGLALLQTEDTACCNHDSWWFVCVYAKWKLVSLTPKLLCLPLHDLELYFFSHNNYGLGGCGC